MTDANTHESHQSQKIRRLAAKHDLVARKSRKDGRWRFIDFNNTLKSPQQGLDDEKALEFLTNN
jgi:hypothetical protein